MSQKFAAKVLTFYEMGNTQVTEYLQANGSANPSYTLVNVMKVRDQSLCHTGHLYYIRQPCGRYDERPSEDCCKRELTRAPIAPSDIRITDDSIWIPMVF